MKGIATAAVLILLTLGALLFPQSGLCGPDLTRPRLLITGDDLTRLRKQAHMNNLRWLFVYNWAKNHGPAKKLERGSQSLALVYLLLKDKRPQQARLLGRVAVDSVLSYALSGNSKNVGRSTLTPANDKIRQYNHKKTGLDHLVPNTQKRNAFPLTGWGKRQILVDARGIPLQTIAKRGDPFALISGDLGKATELVTQAALVLDWAWPAFTAQERKQVAHWMVAQAQHFQNRGKGCFDLESTQVLRLLAMAGEGARGLHPQAEALARQALEKHYRGSILPCLMGAGEGGGWFGSESAGALAGLDLILFATLIKSTSGQDITLNNPWFTGRLSYLAFQMLPGFLLTKANRGYRRIGPGGDEIISGPEAHDLVRWQLLLLLALRPQDQAAGLAQNLLSDPLTSFMTSPHREIYNFIWLYPDRQQGLLSLTPLAYWARGVGRAFLRSNWTSGGTWLSFRCGPHFSASQHLDAGSLLLFHRKMLLPSGAGYDGPATPHALNYGVRSVAHNTILIHDPKEFSWPAIRGVKGKRGSLANDGGQRGMASFGAGGKVVAVAPWTAAGWAGGAGAWKKNQGIYDTARIEAMTSKSRFHYLRGNLTKAYQGSTAKASRVVRHVFHLLPDGPQDAQAQEVVAVVDDLVVRRTEARVRVALHFANRPSTSSSLKEIGPGRLAGPAADLTVKAGGSRLVVKTVYPPGAWMQLYGDADQASFWVDGKNYPPRPPAQAPSLWRAEIGPKQAVGRSRPMVHCLLPGTDQSSTPVEVVSQPTSGSPAVSFIIKDPQFPRMIAVRLGDPGPDGGFAYSFPGGNSRHIVAGLKHGAAYDLKVEARRISLRPGSQIKSNPSGLIFFTVRPAGELKKEAAGQARIQGQEEQPPGKALKRKETPAQRREK